MINNVTIGKKIHRGNKNEQHQTLCVILHESMKRAVITGEPVTCIRCLGIMCGMAINGDTKERGEVIRSLTIRGDVVIESTCLFPTPLFSTPPKDFSIAQGVPLREQRRGVYHDRSR